MRKTTTLTFVLVCILAISANLALAQASDEKSKPENKSDVSSAAPLVITTPQMLPPPTAGTPYKAVISASGGTGSYQWSLTFGKLPSGLSLVLTECIVAPCQTPATISGTPDTSGVHTFVVSVSAGGEVVSQKFGINIKAAPKPKAEKQPKPVTYFKAKVIHGDFGLYGFSYYFNDFAIEIEHHWSRRHLGLAGFSVGYRKEDFSSSSFGHFFNSKVFWKAEGRGFYLKPGIGAEWGKPSPRFEQTRFHHKGTTMVSYERIRLERNAWMPVGVEKTGTFNPFFELGVGQKVGPFIFEGGAKVGYDKFGVDIFQFTNDNLTFQGFKEEYNFIPTLYVGVGLKLF